MTDKVTTPSSGDRGKPVTDLLARVERKHPGIEENIGLSSAALRAGQIVREMRKSHGWTQSELAAKLGWDQERISNIERGEGTRGPTFDILQKIAAACDHELQFTPRKKTFRVMIDELLGELMPKPQSAFQWGLIGAGPQPKFLNACSSFMNTIAHDKLVDVTVADNLKVAATAKPAAPTVPCIELTSHGKRMMMVPVMIGSAPKTAGAPAAGVSMKLFSRSTTDV